MGNICCNQDCVTNNTDSYPVIHSPKKVKPNYDTDIVKGAGGGYMFYNAMDDNNKKALDKLERCSYAFTQERMQVSRWTITSLGPQGKR